MKNRLFSFFLVVALLVSVFPTARASQFGDTEGHWAAFYIDEVTRLGLFSGTSADTFSPDEPMTRAMFLTVLGRLARVDSALWNQVFSAGFFSDVKRSDFYAPYSAWGFCTHIVRGELRAKDALTREEAAQMLVQLSTLYGCEFVPEGGVLDAPRDYLDLSDASEGFDIYIDVFSRLRLFFGPDEDADSEYFLPKQTVTRAEAAALVYRVHQMLQIDDDLVGPEAITLGDTAVTLLPGDVYTLAYDLTPLESLIGTSLFWYSTDESVVTVNSRGILTAHRAGSATIYVIAENGVSASCGVYVSRGPLADENESYNDKCMRIFGKVVSEPRKFYYHDGAHDYDAASRDMVGVTVLTWDFDANGEKITKSRTVYVHKNIAETIAAIFNEIYHGEEQFPIHYLGGFSHGGTSEHTIGTAVDINPNENYYCDPNGNAIVGSYWKPGEDPYSILPDGDVVRAFAKYGFTQGIYWRSGYKDYMHFSYFGT